MITIINSAKSLLLFVIVFFLPLLVYSQSEPQAGDMQIGQYSPDTWVKENSVVPPSPEAASLGTYGNVPINYYTGAPNINIPLTSIQGKYLGASATLSYNSEGIKVGSVPSWVGLGWSLQAGGVITRSAQGAPDCDFNYYNFRANCEQYVGEEFEDIATRNNEHLVFDQEFLAFVANGNIELQPDVYFFNFMGQSGSFVIMPDRSIITQNYTDLDIRAQFTGGKLISFFITDNLGNKYYFQDAEKTNYVIEPNPDTYNLNRDKGLIEYDFNSSWYLTRVDSYDQSEQLDFTYTNHSDAYEYPSIPQTGSSQTFSLGGPTIGPQFEGDQPPCGNFGESLSYSTGGGPSVKIYNRKLLAKITLSIGGVEAEQLKFEEGAVPGDAAMVKSGGYQLNSLKLMRAWPSGGLQNAVAFNFSYDTANDRLTLKSVHEQPGTDNNTGKTLFKPPYKFEYEPGSLLGFGSTKIDYWGYLNGNSSGKLVPYVFYPYGNETRLLNPLGANRTSNGDKAGLLKKITYPTGGYTEFEFEPHEVWVTDPLGIGETTGKHMTVGGFRIREIIDKLASGGIASQRAYKYKNSSSGSSGLLMSKIRVTQHHEYEQFGAGGCIPPNNPACSSFKCNRVTIFATNLSPIGSIVGGHVGYSRVEEIFGKEIGGNIGRKVYHFENDELSNGILWENKNGTLLKLEVKNSSGAVVQETINTYTYDCPDDRECKEAFGIKVVPQRKQTNHTFYCKTVSGSYQWQLPFYAFGQEDCAEPDPAHPILSNRFTTRLERDAYLIKTTWKQLQTSTVNYKFDHDLGGTVTKTTTYEYTDPSIVAPTAYEFQNSDGKTYRTEISYAKRTGPFPQLTGAGLRAIPQIVTKKVGGQITGGIDYTRDNFGRITEVKEILVGGTRLSKALISGYDAGRPVDYKYMDYPLEEFTWVNGLITQRKKLDWIWDYNYTPFRQLESATGIDGQEVKYKYDGLLRLLETDARQGGVVTTYGYLYGDKNQTSQSTTYSDDTPSQLVLQEFDGLGRLVSSTHNDIKKEEILYDGYGRISAQTHLVGNREELSYDNSPLNRLTATLLPDGYSIQTKYGAEENAYKVTSIDEKNQASSIITDIVGRNTKTIDALTGTTEFEYDDRANILKITTPKGAEYNYGYDGRNRQIFKRVPGVFVGTVLGYYDEDDLLEYSIDGNGNRLDYQYDDYKRQTKVFLENELILETTYHPDDARNAKVNQIHANSAKVLYGGSGYSKQIYEYDDFGRMVEMKDDYPVKSGAQIIDLFEYKWNMADWQKTERRTHTGPEDFSSFKSHRYDKFGRKKSSFFSGSKWEGDVYDYRYNNRDQLESKSIRQGLVFLDYDYYDSRGWLKNINQAFDTGMPLANCAPPAVQNDPGGIIPDPNSDNYIDQISVEEFLRERFDARLQIKETGRSTCPVVDCEPPGVACTASDIQVALDEIYEEIRNTITVTKDIPCADGSTETITTVNTEVLFYPFTLQRIRMCDNVERYFPAQYVDQLPGDTSDYKVVQSTVVSSPGQTFQVAVDDGEFQTFSLTEIFGLLIEGTPFDVEGFVPCGEPNCSISVSCTPGELAVQQAILAQLQRNFEQIDLDNIELPIDLYTIAGCGGETFYLLEDELGFLEESTFMIVDVREIPVVKETSFPVGLIDALDQPNRGLFHLSMAYQPNGNIHTLNWQVKGRAMSRYSMDFDVLNRLKYANYSELLQGVTLPTSDKNYSVNGIGYDADGNIERLQRRGLTGYCENGLPLYGDIDDLTYRYESEVDNQLTSILEGSDPEKGFKKDGDGEYQYDNAGNLISDPYKGLTVTEYNYLNLPERIEKAGTGESIEFMYDASGRNLGKTVVAENGPSYTLDHAAGAEYRSGRLESVYHEEGRVYFPDPQRNKFPGREFVQEYFIRDHLGNTRLSVADLDGDNKITPSADEETNEILQETHYYPFGMAHEGPWAKHPEKDNTYLYNGKELTADLDLGWYEYGARWYDPAIGRFTGVDPISDQFPYVSTYNYAENEPIGHIDLHGLQQAESPLLKASTSEPRDYRGIIRQASPELRASDPLRAGVVDGTHFILSIVGLNDIDNQVAIAFDSDAPVSQRIFSALGVLMSGKSNSGKRGSSTRSMKLDNAAGTKGSAADFDSPMAENSKKGSKGTVYDGGGVKSSNNPEAMDGAVDYNGHTDANGNINYQGRTVTPETAGRFARRYHKDATAFRCVTCFGSIPAKAIHQATGKPTIGPSGVIIDSRNGLFLPPGGKIIKFEK